MFYGCMPHEPTAPSSAQLVLFPEGTSDTRKWSKKTTSRHVISASKRTDIPAFYLPWFVDKVQAGYVDVVNSRYRHITHRVSLDAADVLGIVWWSKNYHVYLRDRFYRVFAQYERQFFHFTVNSRRPDLEWLEPDVPSENTALEQFKRLAERRGPESIAWRNDPLVFWSEGGTLHSSWDLEFFERMCKSLSNIGIRSVFVSIADPYLKFRRRIASYYPKLSLRDPSGEELSDIAMAMAGMCSQYGMRLQSCAEPLLQGLSAFEQGACIDSQFFGSSKSPASDRSMKGRESCGCTIHRDIGDYVSQECGYSCIYCYANPNHRRFHAPPNRARDPDVADGVELGR
jgi:hypothetical protein